MSRATLHLVTSALGCGGPMGRGADTAGPRDAAQARVLFVGIDGMRPDALVAAQTPNLDRLRTAGRWSLSAQTQQTGATSSAPGWTSIFTGVEVSQHGVEANGAYENYNRSFQTFAGLARRQLGRSTSAAAHWPQVLSDIHRPDDFDEALLTNDDGVATHLASQIASGGADLLLAHLDDVDSAGHNSGFSMDNPAYLAAIEAQDARVGLLLTAIDNRPASEDWLVVITTDHGGSGIDHGAMDSANQTIPLVVWTEGSEPGEMSAASAPSHLDVFPTVLSWLGAGPALLAHAAGQPRLGDRRAPG